MDVYSRKIVGWQVYDANLKPNWTPTLVISHFSDLLVALHINQLKALGDKKLGAVGIMVEPGFAEGGLEDLNL